MEWSERGEIDDNHRSVLCSRRENAILRWLTMGTLIFCWLPVHGTPISDIVDAKANAEQLCRIGRKTEALEKLYATALHAETAPTLSTDEVRQWAQFLFEVGEQHKTYAEGGSAGQMRSGYAEKARKVFYKYLDWYDALTDDQRELLREVDRTFIATSFIGQLFNEEQKYNAAITKYEFYARTHIDWIGLDAIKIWQSALTYGASAKQDPAHWEACADAITQVLNSSVSERNLGQTGREKLKGYLENARQHHVTTTAKQSAAIRRRNKMVRYENLRPVSNLAAR